MRRGCCKKGEIEILKENIEFKNEFATLYNDEVIFPSGKTGKYLRYTSNAPYGVMLLAQDAGGRLLLLRNFRHENRTWSWEIPKGFGENHLSPLDCAKKELFEEAGCEGQDWQLYKKVLHSQLEVYMYSVLVKTNVSVVNQEEKEAISEARFFEKDELHKLLHSSETIDAATMFFIALNLPLEPLLNIVK